MKDLAGNRIHYLICILTFKQVTVKNQPGIGRKEAKIGCKKHKNQKNTCNFKMSVV